MRRVVLAGGLLSCLLTFSYLVAQTPKPVDIIPVSAIQKGMRGVAYTVFQGTKPESMDVEVLGVLKNANGPKGDIILVRLSGKQAEYTGVVAGMSGSPVYLEGKLAGALAFRIGEFSKEAIAGVTPIAEMLEINALDTTPEAHAPASPKAGTSASTSTSGPGLANLPALDAPVQQFANFLKPIETPLVFNGFSKEAVELVRLTVCRCWYRARHGRGLGK